MIFPKVLILTLFIFGTFGKGSTESVEERIEALERKVSALTKACEMEDIETDKQFKVIKSIVSCTT